MATTLIKHSAPPKAPKQYIAVGKRKSSIARVIMTPGKGTITVNNREEQQYFSREVLRFLIRQPLEATGTTSNFDIIANIIGGGLSGQANALKHGIARALLTVNPDYRKPLKTAGYLTRDSRIVERKKYGRHKARKRPQYSKR